MKIKPIVRTALAVLLLAAATTVGILACPCPTEDSIACTWYADRQGNGQGSTFTAVTESIVVRH